MDIERKIHPHHNQHEIGCFHFSEDVARIFAEMQPGKYRVLGRILEKYGIAAFTLAMDDIASVIVSKQAHLNKMQETEHYRNNQNLADFLYKRG